MVNTQLKTEPIVAKRTRDVGFIRSIVGELWDTVAEDGQLFEEWEPKANSECWLNISDTAVYCLNAENSTTLLMHAHVSKSARAYSRTFSVAIGHAVWVWVLENSDYQKFNCAIPVIYPNVKAYVEKMGMIEEGVNRKSYCKNGEIVDQWLMGITRDELEEFMK